ncbi:hypothetical protein [Odoribacter lunatus]|uniref:hypothetical protein n=1 Tax=Odoribacter lunatus TaxID=2941335 RepID=UPI00203CF871|nr:hypothetical protein [Odoribacter lunatus]
MKKWKDYTKQERAMLIAIGILLILILLTSGRVKNGIQKGFQRFFTPPVESIDK